MHLTESAQYEVEVRLAIHREDESLGLKILQVQPGYREGQLLLGDLLIPGNPPVELDFVMGISSHVDSRGRG